MQPDLLQQLRDIHVPQAPGWWPPAPGWWLIAALALWGAVQLTRYLLAAHRRRRPLVRAQRLYAQLWAQLVAEQLDATAYAHATNELLKRLFIHGLGIAAARPATDEAWLELLDEHSGDHSFTKGAGHILGNDRFRRDPHPDVAGLHAAVTRLLRKVRPA